MFNKGQYQFLLTCVDAFSCTNTQAARNKGFMMMQLVDQIEQMEKMEQELAKAPPKKAEKKPAAKPRASTKAKK